MSATDVEKMPAEEETSATSASSSSEPPRFEIKSTLNEHVVLYPATSSMRSAVHNHMISHVRF